MIVKTLLTLKIRFPLINTLIIVFLISCDFKKETRVEIQYVDCLLYNESCDLVNPNPITFCNYGFNLSLINKTDNKIKYKILNKLDYLVTKERDTLYFDYFRIDEKKVHFIDFKNQLFEVNKGKEVLINFQDSNVSFSDFESFDLYMEKLQIKEGATFYLNSLEINGKSNFIVNVKENIERRYFIDDILTNNKSKIKRCSGNTMILPYN